MNQLVQDAIKILTDRGYSVRKLGQKRPRKNPTPQQILILTALNDSQDWLSTAAARMDGPEQGRIMVKRGWIEYAENKRVGSKHRKVMAWKITDEGQRILKFRSPRNPPANPSADGEG